MELPVIDADQLYRLLPVADAVDALEAAFGADRLPDAPQRVRVGTDAGEILLMPASGTAGIGVKLVTLSPGNPERGLPFVQGVYVLFSADSQVPEAIIDGAALTGLRTGAVSGLATRHLARPEADRLVIFGAGVQAGAHLDAMRAVRPIQSVVVVSRSPGPAADLAGRGRSLGLAAEVGDPAAVTEADIVCTCTTSAEPVFDGSLLPAGAHVNAVGSYRPDMRELDETTVRRGRLVVETRDAALEEAGDLLMPIGAGVITTDDIVELSDVVRGTRVRRGPQDVTVFKSVGVAFEDLVVARAALDRLVG
ncbi:MAG: ornithine cyclodeaminase family protein [Actinomycetota bacterium]